MQYEFAEDIAKITNEYLKLKEKKIDCELVAVPDKLDEDWFVKVINKS